MAHRGEQLIESCEELLGSVRASVRINTSASLESYVHPGAVALFRSRPEWVDVDLKFQQEDDWRVMLQQLRNRSIDLSIHWLTPERDPRDASSATPPALLDELTFDTFDRPFPMVAIMLPSHPLAVRAEEKGLPVRFEDLAGYPVYRLPRGRQPLLERVPGGAARIEVSSYDKAVNYIRLGPILGVSLVPFMPSLDEARRRMEITYVPLEDDAGGVRVAVCMRKRGAARLSPAAMAYLDAFKQHLTSIPRVPGWDSSWRPSPLPEQSSQILAYGRIYYVSSSGPRDSGVRWRAATVQWAEPKLVGDIVGTTGTLTINESEPISQTFGRVDYQGAITKSCGS